MIHSDELEKLETLMRSKTFAELTVEERIWVAQWIESESEYTILRVTEGAIKKSLDSDAIVPDPKILNHLKATFRAKQATPKLNWWQIKMPGWSTLVIASMFCVLGWWIGSSANEVIKEQVYSSTIVYDTVYLASKPDTIFIQQVVYRERSLLAKTVKQLGTLSNETPAKGINMKEKEELENLLVSGSR